MTIKSPDFEFIETRLNHLDYGPEKLFAIFFFLSGKFLQEKTTQISIIVIVHQVHSQDGSSGFR
jgi:hypothetical protein